MRMIEVKEYVNELVKDIVESMEKNAEIGKLSDLLEMCDEDDLVKFIYIGEPYELAPSGKMYMPWATGNLTPCSHCNGKSFVRKPHVKHLHRCKQFVKDIYDKREEFMHKHSKNVNWYLTSTAKRYYKIMQKYKPSTMCRYCNGDGYRETYEDATFWELLEKELSSKGIFLSEELAIKEID